MKSILFFLMGILALLLPVDSINLESVREGPCIAPAAAVNFDLAWATSKSEWFYPLWSKYEVYRWTTSISGFDERIISDELIDSSCQVLFVSTQTGALHLGFAGTRKSKFESKQVSKGVFDWVEIKEDGSRGNRGRSYITFSDNKTFFVSVNCWSDNARGFLVHSITKTLDDKTKEIIKQHLASLGFDVTRKMYEMPYDNCVGLPVAPQKSQLLASGSENLETIVDPPTRVETYANEPDSRQSSPFAKIFSLFGSKFEFFRNLVQTIFQLLSTPFRILTSLLGLGSSGVMG